MLKEAIAKLIEGKNLNEDEAISSLDCIMSGKATDAQIGSFITALRIKGETIEEVTGCAKVMREKAYKINPKIDYYIDTCGTGGDGSNTLIYPQQQLLWQLQEEFLLLSMGIDLYLVKVEVQMFWKVWELT